MEAYVAAAVAWLLAAFALPSVGLLAIFIVSLVSATLLPLGSEPVVYGYVLLTQAFWPAVLVATLGNTLGGIVSYAMGSGVWRLWRAWLSRSDRKSETWKKRLEAQEVHQQSPDTSPGPEADSPKGEYKPFQEEFKRLKGEAEAAGGKWHTWCVNWLRRLGPRALFFSWLPGVGDPLCAVAGYLRFPFWSSVMYMAIGKFLRYVVMTAALLWFYSGPEMV